MKQLYDQYSFLASKYVTKKYSTSFYTGVMFLDHKIRNDIHAIYGFVRLADEIVDSFHDYNKQELLDEFKADTYKAIDQKISLNPVLHSFQYTVNEYQIDRDLIDQFLHSMEMDLNPLDYDQNKYEEYILGSAEVVGLMCLKVFVYGDQEKYDELKPYAMKLGSAFQKINFLRDLKADVEGLGRVYFPNIGDEGITPENKLKIEREIEEEFNFAYKGILKLPKSSRFGVYVSYVYYTKLLAKIKRKTTQELMSDRIRVSNKRKAFLFAKSYFRNSINLL
ncbi:phytoene/squalene synthase family protein [Paracrocinitomix mangrovi]|uniref:phytoene/squalene synthase family protein n=1 Tax=Paracrocinitomix mangrovi TaxID=2862509 RepID=UPI001C8DB65C|nr:phytoene/squalene synthase family protein [Paracrocinitomix mangrovi]UKN03616.1 phytoene/squalene synthase family protein [Paracrocinitomix mangrovi]